jgi:pyruvate/2-oxoglutarate dehydrogenase complex dihydrolipoamide dehydrogenase (E3) component
MAPIPGTGERIACDALILSVGLIPENELAEALSIPLDYRTRGPVSDQSCMTMLGGVFCCGNALHVNDLVDYVSESGEAAGRAAAHYAPSERAFADMKADENFLYVVPQKIDLGNIDKPVTVYFRSFAERGKTRLTVTANGKEIYKKTYNQLRPPEMERVEIDVKHAGIEPGDTVNFALAEVK